MDPYAVLGLSPGASLDEAARAYRRLAKEWHPDRAGESGMARMIGLNVAYELLRAEQRPGARVAVTPPSAPGTRARAGPLALRSHATRARPRAAGGARARRARGARHADRDVGEPSTLLAVTDRRLLWLLDDAVGNRVRSLRFRDTALAEPGLVWPRRTRARLSVEPRSGAKRWTFSDLRPATAEAIAGYVRAGLPAAPAGPVDGRART